MCPHRVEPFRLALGHLRARLRAGDLRPGDRVAAREVAETLGLSPTPVREALCRLAGEGLLEERRGDGVFVAALSATDIADLYRICGDLLGRAQAADRAPRRDLAGPPPADDADPLSALERLFAVWVAESASRVLVERYRTAALRLIPARRLEPQVLPDLRAEATGLLALADAAGRPRRPAALARFHARRIAAADRLAQALDPDGSMQI